MFWGDQGSDEIVEANLDGTGRRKVLDADYNDGFEIDHGNRVYCIGAYTTGDETFSNSGKSHFSIRRATLGDWEVETIIENVGWLHGLAVDAIRDRLYFTTSEPGRIFVSTLDGRNRRSLVKTANENIIHELTIDPSSGDLYWSEELSPNRDRIRRHDAKTGVISIVGPVEGFGSINSFLVVPDKSETIALPRAERSREETSAEKEGAQSVAHPAIVSPTKPDHMDLEMLMRPGEPPSLKFLTSAGSRYRVQYSNDLKEWRDAGDPIIASGAFLTWTDPGPPVTESLPGVAPRRFYRIVELE
jgi:hypothetical protein